MEEHLLCKQGVRGSSPLSSTRQNTLILIMNQGARAINVPLACLRRCLCGAVVGVVLAVSVGLL
jgi:hypothetical protein